MNEEHLIKEIQDSIDAPKAFFVTPKWTKIENRNSYETHITLRPINNQFSIDKIILYCNYNVIFNRECATFLLLYQLYPRSRPNNIMRIEFNPNKRHQNKPPFPRHVILTSHVHNFMVNIEAYGLNEAIKNLPYAEQIDGAPHSWQEMLEIACKLFNIDDIKTLQRPQIQEELF